VKQTVGAISKSEIAPITIVVLTVFFARKFDGWILEREFRLES
jgi:hypothetical protein